VSQRALQPHHLRLRPADRSAMEKLRIATLGISWGIAHEAVSRRPPISLCRMVARTHMYTYAPKCWDLSSFKAARRQTLM
jgi:hypothetical protein